MTGPHNTRVSGRRVPEEFQGKCTSEREIELWFQSGEFHEVGGCHLSATVPGVVPDNGCQAKSSAKERVRDEVPQETSP